MEGKLFCRGAQSHRELCVGGAKALPWSETQKKRANTGLEVTLFIHFTVKWNPVSCSQVTGGSSPCLLRFTPLKSGWVEIQTPVEWRIEHMEYSCRMTLEERAQTQPVHKWVFCHVKWPRRRGRGGGWDSGIHEEGWWAGGGTSGTGPGPLPFLLG